MNKSGTSIFRVAFWIFFLSGALVAGVFFWKKFDPPRQYPFLIPHTVRFYLKRLTHPHPAVAHDAWQELHQLYFTKWAAYEIILDHVQDAEPIHFLIEKQKVPVPGKPAQDGYYAANKPIYYKTDEVYCHTVGEAILAIALNERKGKAQFDGNWSAWWQKDRGYYGR